MIQIAEIKSSYFGHYKQIVACSRSNRSLYIPVFSTDHSTFKISQNSQKVVTKTIKNTKFCQQISKMVKNAENGQKLSKILLVAD